MKKLKALCIILAAMLLMMSTACDDEYYPEDDETDYSDNIDNIDNIDKNSGNDGQNDEWAIYWYLCGSDLESDGGCATNDLAELTSVTLPDNVTVVVETGGAAEWQNDVIDSSKLQRYVYRGDSFVPVDEQPKANMGDPETLADFLQFAKDNYPAEKTAVIFWNHGGGSVSGAAFDENYSYDSLTLDEMYIAFGGVWQLDESNPPIDLIGFDTCLMATVDVAYTFSDIARYLVASEETEPGNGWYYTGLAEGLADDPSMDGEEFGRLICDSYYEGCEMYGTEDDITLSLTDLSKIGPLLDAYEAFGNEALSAVCENAGFYSRFARAAASSENYGGNTKEQGYTNMVDLGDIAKKSADILPDSSVADDVISALGDCVIYSVNGPYRSSANGLSCYYSYNADIDDFNSYVSLGASEAFKYYYSYGLTGSFDGLDDVDEYLEENTGSTSGDLPELPTLNSVDWNDIKPEVDDDGTAYITLGEQAYDILAGIGFQLCYIDGENDYMVLLGTDNDIIGDWDNGVFGDNFRGVWGAIDGCLVYMELSNEGDDYNLYSVPILLNGEEYNLQVAYDFSSEAWSIIGARRGIDENGMADKELRILKVGDEITTLHYISSLSGNDDFEAYGIDTLTVTEDTCFGETELFDGDFMLMFEMYDAAGNYAYSDAVWFEYADGEIYTSVN